MVMSCPPRSRAQLLGVMLVSAIVLVEYLGGWLEAGLPATQVRFEGSRAVEIVGLILLFVSVGIYEELLFRGYLLKNLAEGWCFPWLGPRRFAFPRRAGHRHSLL